MTFCFEKKLTRSPTEIICSASSFLTYWAGLQKGSDKEELEEGAGVLKKAVLHFHPQATGDDAGVVLITSTNEDILPGGPVVPNADVHSHAAIVAVSR